ncbi:MAG: ABC transporter ATP-binding protein [Candidatus Peribacteraceae bacterium]|jgi:ABC-type multidrug transport system fused ATPase/permease subunit
MKLILHLLWQYTRRYPWRSAVALALTLVISALWVIEPLYSAFAIDALLKIREGQQVNIASIFLLWGALFVFISVVQSLQKLASWELQNRVFLARREETYEHLLRLDIVYHTGKKSGETIKILDEGADNFVDLHRFFFSEIGPSMLSSLAFFAISFTIQPLLAGILVTVILGYLLIVVFGVKKTMQLQLDINKLWVEAIGRAYDAAANVFSVKSNAQEGYEMRLMERSDGKAHGKQKQVNLRWALVEAINFFMLARLLLIGVGILLYVRNALTLGQLYFFQFSFYRVLTPFEILANMLPLWNRVVGKVRLSQDILDTPVSIKNADHPAVLRGLKGDIGFEEVCFAYGAAASHRKPEDVREPPAPALQPSLGSAEEEETARSPNPIENLVETEEAQIPDGHADDAEQEKEILRLQNPPHGREVLHDILLDIRAGEHIAFVGHSGAGKTTIAMLLNRFYDVTHGRITVDGTDLRQLDLGWWRSQIGLVLQENIMFNDSIEENIRYSRREATTEEVREAAGRAAAGEFIENLPEGYKTLIGERGIRLSGGQRQRIAIARAILKNPKIVILDEATSALDSVTERKVQEGIRELVTGRTAVIIAHRLSTVRSVNRIAVLDKGRLVAAAPHEELVKTCGIYREMVELQSQGMLAE